jgi:allantoicase
VPLAASDQFFSEPLNLLMPGRPVDMGDGWETRRRRRPGHDWVILRLGHRGSIDEVVVDTTHFKGNFPTVAGSRDWTRLSSSPPWPRRRRRLARAGCPHQLKADTPHRFRAVGRSGPVTHVRFSMFPDGGVARLRLLGKPVV